MNAVRLLVVLLIRVYGSPLAIPEVQRRRNTYQLAAGPIRIAALGMTDPQEHHFPRRHSSHTFALFLHLSWFTNKLYAPRTPTLFFGFSYSYLNILLELLIHVHVHLRITILFQAHARLQWNQVNYLIINIRPV